MSMGGADMAKGEQMSICVEGQSGKVHVSDFRSMVRQRRLVFIALFVALLPLVITRSYFFYTDSNVPSENTRFFAGQSEPTALHVKPPFEEDVPHVTEVISPHSNTNGTQTDHDQTESKSRNEEPEPNFSEKASSNFTSTVEEEEAAKPMDLEVESPNLNQGSIRSLNTPANGTSSDFKIGTGNGKNVSSSSFVEGSTGASSLAVNTSSGHSDDLLKETVENNTSKAQKTAKEENTGDRVMDGTTAPSAAQNTSDLPSSEGDCNLEQGKWIPDYRPSMYNSSTCRHVQDHQNCHKNGRPDDGYLYWRWQPDQCELPRIDATAFLIAMRNRSIVFAGDSIARNQFQSLLCILSQMEDPKNTYKTEDGRNNVYHFRSFNFTLAIYWSPYLVRVEDKATTWPDNTTQTVTHIYVDELDKRWTEPAVGADILHISTGQWWYKRALYLEKNKPLGCHGWPACKKEIGFDPPYNKAIANILKGSLTIPGFTGTTVFRSFSPAHFENGDWDTGGECLRTTPGGVTMSYLTEWMYNIQLKQFNNVTEELGAVAKDRLKLLGITNLSQIRADGHPNVFRAEGDKKSERRANGVPHDCLHWCLPGPIDTWNDLLVQSLHDVIFK